MKSNTRLTRINDEIVRVLAEVIRGELRDPRLEMVGVQRAETTKDLKFCKIYVSALGQSEADVLAALKSANGLLRKRLADTLDLRQTPELIFKYDDGLVHAMKMQQRIAEVVRKDEEK